MQPSSRREVGPPVRRAIGTGTVDHDCRELLEFASGSASISRTDNADVIGTYNPGRLVPEFDCRDLGLRRQRGCERHRALWNWGTPALIFPRLGGREVRRLT